MTAQEAVDIIRSYRHEKHTSYPEQVKEALRTAHDKLQLSPYKLHKMMEGSCQMTVRKLLGYKEKTSVDPDRLLRQGRDGYVKTLVHDDGPKPKHCPKCGSSVLTGDFFPVYSESDYPAWIRTWQCHLCSYSPNKAQRIYAFEEKA